MPGIVFFGSPAFAAPSLESLAAAGLAPLLVVTQPDRPAGRGRRLAPTDVRRRAEELGLPVAVAEGFRDARLLRRLEELGPEFFVVVAFGLIFPQKVLEIPSLAPINVHASLLPAWRGASPVNMAVVNGDTVTGVSTMRMVKELDAGPVYLRRSVAIEPRETAGELAARLAVLGAQLLVETLRGILDEGLEPAAQPVEGVSYAPRLHKRDGLIPWGGDAVAVHNHIRGMNPWPGSHTRARGSILKVLAAEPARVAVAGAAPGTVLDVAGAAVVAACGKGAVRLLRLQAQGRRPQPAEEFLRGFKLAPGDLLGKDCDD